MAFETMKLQSQLGGIHVGHIQGVLTAVDRPHRAMACIGLDGQGNGTAACSQIQHLQGLGTNGQRMLFQKAECPIDQSFCVGSGVKHSGIDPQIQAVKLFVTGDVRQWDMIHSLLGIDLKALKSFWAQDVIAMGQKPRSFMTFAPQSVKHEQLSFKGCERGRFEAKEGFMEGGRRGHGGHGAGGLAEPG